MASHLDWVPNAIIGGLATVPAAIVAYVTRSRWKKAAHDDTAADATRVLLATPAEWRRLYLAVCHELEQAKAEIDGLEQELKDR